MFAQELSRQKARRRLRAVIIVARFVVQLRRKNLPKTALDERTKETLGNKFTGDAGDASDAGDDGDDGDDSDAATRRDQEMSERTIHLGEWKGGNHIY